MARAQYNPGHRTTLSGIVQMVRRGSTMTLAEAKQINRRKYLLEWDYSEVIDGLRTAEEEDWGGAFADWKEGLKKFNGSGHLSITTRGKYGALQDKVIVWEIIPEGGIE